MKLDHLLLRAAMTSVAAGLAAASLCQSTAFYDNGSTNQITCTDLGKKTVISPDGAIYIAGNVTSTSGNGLDIAVIKYNYSGGTLSRQWVATYDGPGHGNDTVSGLAVDASGARIYVAGNSFNSSGHQDATVVAFDANGFYAWPNGDHAIRYSSASTDDNCTDMCIDSGGNIAICGYSDVGTSTKAFIDVLTPLGVPKRGWPVTYGGGGAKPDLLQRDLLGFAHLRQERLHLRHRFQQGLDQSSKPHRRPL